MIDVVTAVTAGTGTTPSETRRTLPWLHPTTRPGTGQTGDAITRRFKNKAGYLRRCFTDTQLGTI
ncbi:hypothetical protein [Streptomyces chattanoogensis]|uniref:Uncharacterized protein n=1 Tax=Streptomyces chattanoogensis TaxID=66876 RepID=A0A0N0GX65_9ACTN|nr:hypothetical protein [Streptomyces chattanoogensis]KPC60682.1 hypothetical protein ADL29_27970 [Streptomyces chattanoogensis]